MLHYVFIGATWLIGIFGATGAVAAVVAFIYLGPAVVIPILQSAFSRFIACTKCVIAVVFVLATVGAYWVGHHQAEKQCRAAELNSELAAQRQDNSIAQQAAADEANRAIDIEVNASEQHKKDLAFIASHAGDTACGFDPLYGDDAGGVPSNVHAPKAKPAVRTK